MIIIPAVDMKDGKAVRLQQGRADQQTIYDADPVHAARRWFDSGAKRIHIVDLDGAFDGVPKNRAFTLQILKAFSTAAEIQIGGGLRDEKIIEDYIAAGAARCVIGTKALEDRAFLERLTARFPGKINVGIDAKGGRVVTQGWVSQSQTLATDMVRGLSSLALGEIIYTDIETDGMLKGPNLKQLAEMKSASPFPLIASGGVTTVENVKACRELGCFGAIIGKAFYDGALDIEEAYKAAAEK